MYIHTFTYTFTFTDTYKYIYMYISIHVHIYIYVKEEDGTVLAITQAPTVLGVPEVPPMPRRALQGSRAPNNRFVPLSGLG